MTTNCAGAQEFPRWRELSPEKAVAEMPRLVEKAEAEIAAVEKSEPKTFEDFVWRLDDAMRPPMRLWEMVSHMHSVMNDDKWRAAVEELQPAVVSFSLRVGQSRELYAHAKRLLGGERENGARRRILEDMVKAAEHSGVALEGDAKKRFCEISAEIAKTGSDFHNAVLDATRDFKFEKDGKTYTIDDAEYPETMKHCADREVRKALCIGRSRRAPENAARISRILALRREIASLLGFGSYAELSIDSKCAPSCAAVMKMIDDLDAATLSRAEEERAELGGGDIMPWDVAYLAERLREKKYSYSEEELKRHFEFAAVLAGMFKMATFLFGVEFREIVGDAMPQTWHEDVRFFEVLRGGSPIAHFYLDPYVRTGLKSGGAWMNSFANRCARRGEMPLALMALNLPVPDGEGKCFMPFREVETLFHEFGHALQAMLTKVDEEDAAGTSLVEWDAVEVASQFMENWCLDDRTGIPVPEDLKRRVRAAKNFRAATACRRQLAFAKTDMLLHLGAVDDPDAVKNEMFAHFGVPSVEGDLFLNSFSHIFGGGYAAGYYGYKWSEVMSADVYGAFEEAGVEDGAKVRELGGRLGDTIFGLGGSVSAYEAFRLFRGREPSIDALLRQQGLLPL